MAGIWKVVSDVPGRIRVRNALLSQNGALCQAVERTLGGVPGVESVRTSELSCSAVVYYDAARIGRAALLCLMAEAEEEKAPALVPGKKPLKGARTIALIFVGFGIFGVLVPGIPGWPFLLVSIPLFSAGSPGESKMDAWLKSKFPNARRKGLELTLKMLQGGRGTPSSARALDGKPALA